MFVLENRNLQLALQQTKPSHKSLSFKGLSSEVDILETKYADFGDEVSEARAIDWLDAGHHCMVAVYKDNIAASIWISIRYPPYGESKKVSGIFENSAYVFKLFVSPQFRRKGIGEQLVTQALLFCLERGFERATTIIYTWNQASVALFEKVGFQKTYRLQIFHLPFNNNLFLVKAI
jgi:ribosomal protein S18 acetylase RimI-like enzyme